MFSLENENPILPRFFRSFALIPKPDGDTSSWFCLWSAQSRYYEFVTAIRGFEDSYRDCLEEELCRALGLKHRDFLVANMAQLNLEFADVLPGQSQPHHIGAAFYMVHLYGEAARTTVEGIAKGRWLSSSELLEGKTADGSAVSPVLTYLLNRSDVIQPW